MSAINLAGIHYDIKFKLNEIDSNKDKRFAIPELDWAINEAQLILIKTITEPRTRSELGFEVSQRSIDDIRSIVIAESTFNSVLTHDKYSYVRTLPEDYLFLISSYSQAKKGTCIKTIRNYSVQHDDQHRENSMSVSSFEWEEINYNFINKGLRAFTDGTFSIEGSQLNYIRRPKYAHLAENHNINGYKLPDGTHVQGSEEIELPAHTHREIADLAVAILSGIIKHPRYQVMLDKLRMTDSR